MHNDTTAVISGCVVTRYDGRVYLLTGAEILDVFEPSAEHVEPRLKRIGPNVESVLARKVMPALSLEECNSYLKGRARQRSGGAEDPLPHGVVYAILKSFFPNAK